MNAIREIKQTTSDSLSLKIPDFLQNRKIEVLMFPYDEASHKKTSINVADSIEELSWNMGKKNILKTLLSKTCFHIPDDFKFNRDEIHER